MSLEEFSSESGAMENVLNKWSNRAPTSINNDLQRGEIKYASTNIRINDMPMKVYLPNLSLQTSLPLNSQYSFSSNYSTSQQYLCCQACSPSSRQKTFPIYAAGFRNVFDLRPLMYSKPLYARFFPAIYQSVTRNCNHNYSSLSKPVLDSRQFNNSLRQLTFETGEENQTQAEFESNLAALKNKAATILRKIKAKVNTFVIRLTGLIFYKCMPLFIKKLLVNRAQIRYLQQLKETNPNVPFLYLPSHQSHMDYLLITFVLFDAGLPSPLLAAGLNMSIPFFRSIFKRLGSYFIKRNNSDKLSALIVREYIIQALLSGQHMEFFSEGTRSRIGKISFPKFGLMTYSMDAVLERGVLDVLIVPTTITYDAFYENYISAELSGQNKRPESITQILQAILRIFTEDIGLVRIDFGQAFSLREYLAIGSMVNENGAPVSIFRPHLQEDRECKVRCLMQHVMYDWSRMSAFSSTSIVAYLLLNAYRQGTTQNQLEKAYSTIHQIATLNGRQFSHTGNPSVIVKNALDHLNPLLYKSTSENPIYQPKLNFKEGLELFFYSNKAIYIFIGEAVIATTLIAIFRTCQCSGQSISRDLLLRRAKTLCQYLSKEFVFIAPCQDITSTLLDAVERMVTQEIFQIREGYELGLKERGLVRAIAASTDNYDDDEYYPHDEAVLVVSSVPEHKLWVTMLQNTLAPYITSYWLTTQALLSLINDNSDEMAWPLACKTVENRLHSYICHQSMVEGRIEACSLEIMKNCLKYMLDNAMLNSDNNDQTYQLGDNDQLMKWGECLNEHRLLSTMN